MRHDCAASVSGPIPSHCYQRCRPRDPDERWRRSYESATRGIPVGSGGHILVHSLIRLVSASTISGRRREGGGNGGTLSKAANYALMTRCVFVVPVSRFARVLRRRAPRGERLLWLRAALRVCDEFGDGSRRRVCAPVDFGPPSSGHIGLVGDIKQAEDNSRDDALLDWLRRSVGCGRT